MRNFLKVTLSLAVALLFMGGTAFGQNNQAEIKQFDIPKGETTAKINQAGFQNAARVVQGLQTTQNRRGVKKSDAEIKQRGNGNWAQILQGRNNGFSAKSSARIKQQGAQNKAEIRQGVDKAAEKNNEASLTQKGFGNEAVIYQGVKGGASQSLKTEANTAVTYQQGNFHYSEIRQGFDSGIETDNAMAKTTQYGGNHWALIVQTGNGGMAEIKQTN